MTWKVKKEVVETQNTTINIKEELVDDISIPLFVDFMGTAIARKIPSFIDGLIPVQRRIVVSLDHLWVRRWKQTKVLSVIWDTVWNYHATWDGSVSWAAIRLGQKHALRYPLIDDKACNYGALGIDPSAPRYLECSLNAFSEEILLKDTSEITTKYVTSYNGKRKEPLVLKPKIPTFFLMNSWSDIAVWVKWERVPHNIEDLCESYLAFLENQNCQIKTLVRKLKWPDFPSGGIVLNTEEEIINMYLTGKWTFTVRGTYELREEKWEGAEIHITSLPFGVIPEDFINRIIEEKSSTSAKKFVDVTDVYDQSSWEDENGNLKIDICLKIKNKKAEDRVIKELIYYKTGFQTNACRLFHWGLDREFKPQLLGLREIYSLFLEDRIDTIKSKLNYELNDQKEKLHIQEGFHIASKNIDEIIGIIRKAENKEKAKENLMKKFKLSEEQANAIGSRNLYSLTKADSVEIEEKIKEIKKRIWEIETILKGWDEAIIKINIEEVKEIRKNFKSKRLTEIRYDVSEREVKDFEEKPSIQDRSLYVGCSDSGMFAIADAVNIKTETEKALAEVFKFKDGSKLKSWGKTSNLTYTLLFGDKGSIYADTAYKFPSNKSPLPIQGYFKKTQAGEAIVKTITFNDNVESKFVCISSQGKWFVLDWLKSFEGLNEKKSSWYFNKANVVFVEKITDKTKWVYILTSEWRVHFLNHKDFLVKDSKSAGNIVCSIYEKKWEKIEQIGLVEEWNTSIKFGKKTIDFSTIDFTTARWFKI